jgi:hypothetical protein
MQIEKLKGWLSRFSEPMVAAIHFEFRKQHETFTLETDDSSKFSFTLSRHIINLINLFITVKNIAWTKG